MVQHINKKAGTAMFHLNNISIIRSFLTPEAVKTMIHSLVFSQLDYCNSLLAGVPKCHIKKLQMVQNRAARVVANVKPSTHITSVLKELHWLPVSFRIRYKVLLMVYKCINGNAPKYLKECCNLRNISQYNIRTNNKLFLEIPCVKRSIGDRAFAVCGPRWWNEIPLSIKSSLSLSLFKK